MLTRHMGNLLAKQDQFHIYQSNFQGLRSLFVRMIIRIRLHKPAITMRIRAAEYAASPWGVRAYCMHFHNMWLPVF